MAGDENFKYDFPSQSIFSQSMPNFQVDWNFLEPPHILGHVTWEWNIPANTVIYSKEWQHVLRDPDGASLGPTTEAWWPRMHEEDVLPFTRVAQEIVEGRNEHYRSLFRVRRADGTWAWLLSKGRVVEKYQGQPVRVLGALMDGSELRSDVKFQHGNFGLEIPRCDAEAGRGPDFSIRVDHSLNSLESHPAITRLLAGERENAAPSGDAPPSRGINEKQREYIAKNVQRVIETGVPVRESVTFPTRYGHEVTGEFCFWPEFDGRDGIEAVMMHFRDTTDQVLYERRARLNELRLDALYQLSQLDSASEKTMLFYAMNSMSRLTGSDRCFLFFPGRDQDGAGRLLWSESKWGDQDAPYVAEADMPEHIARLIKDVTEREEHRVMENGNGLHPLLECADCHYKIMRFILAPVVDDGKVVCMAGVCNKDTDYTGTDLMQLEAFLNGALLILKRHELVRELHRAKDMSEKANVVKDEFLANISHELRTPLNGILSMLQLLDTSILQKEHREYVRTAKYSGQALLRIISDILDFSRMASGKMQIRKEAFDLRLAIASSIRVFQREAKDKGLDFTVDLDESIPRTLVGDDARVMQIIFNIVGNALKFTERGSIRMRCSLLSNTAEGLVRVYLGVHDTGIGIPAEKLETVFDAFTQLDSFSTRRHSGTGLGLGIVRKLTEMMGGSVSIESEVGAGTTVHCSLCFALPSNGTASHEESRKTDIPPVMRPMDILVAEDDAVGSFALCRFLQKAGHRPVCVGNGRLALEALRLYPFHCLFTDIQMPVMDGVEIIRRIRNNLLRDIEPSPWTRSMLSGILPGAFEETVPVPGNLPVVTISAHAMSGDKERFLDAGMDFYLSKPVNMEDLTDVLKKIAEHLDMQGTTIVGG